MALRVTPTLRLARASIGGARMRRVCCEPGRCQPSRSASRPGVLLNEYVGPARAHPVLLSSERCALHGAALVSGLHRRGRAS
eukprot:996745-Karenia_brevis.AAC.1